MKRNNDDVLYFSRMWPALAAIILLNLNSPAFSKDHLSSKKLEKSNQSPTNKTTWQRSCTNKASPKSCKIFQDLFLKKTTDGVEQHLGRLIRIMVSYKPSSNRGLQRPFLVMKLPLGVDLRPGAIVRVDKHAEISLKFQRCTKEGCTVSRKIDDIYIREMRRGSRLNIGFRVWGANKLTVVQATLNGFSRALNSVQWGNPILK